MIRAMAKQARTKARGGEGDGRTSPRPGAGDFATLWPAIQPLWDARALALQYQLEASQWWPPERLLARQLRQVQLVLEHAAATVPFYRGRLDAALGLAPGALTLEHVSRLPILTRQEIQQAGDRLHSRKLPPEHGAAAASRTSGSSGRPIEFLYTSLTTMMVHALSMRGHLWHRRDLGLKSLVLRPPRPGMPENAVYHWAPVPYTGRGRIFDMRRPIEEVFEHLVTDDPAYLQSHPYVIVGLLRRSEETGIRPESLREVRVYGECLEPWMRELCSRVWGVPMTDNYSAEECGTIAHQCPESTSLHVQSESVLVEVLDETGAPCGPGERGRVVVTGLHNFAMPLVREELGDIAEVGAACACGRGLPVLTRILGRERNLFVLPSGKKVFPELYVEFGTVPAIRQWQVIQKSLERLEIKLEVARPLTTEEAGGLRRLIQDSIGHPFEIAFVYVDDIPREPSGKYQDYRSEVYSASSG